MTEVLAGLALGAASSAHCAVMCGPLVAAWRQHTSSALHMAVYHAARIAAYGGMGAVAGSVGHAVSLGGFATALSVGAGIVLIAMAFGRVGLGRGVLTAGTGRLVGRWLVRSRRALGARPMAGSVASGCLNALIPCGLLYAALGASAATGTPRAAATMMSAYGIATLPFLLAAWWSAGMLSLAARRRWRFVVPATLVLTGLLLVGRGILDHRHQVGAEAVPSSHADHVTIR